MDTQAPFHPGHTLVSEYLVPRQISINALARDMGISRKHLSNIANGHVRITPQVALRLGRALNTPPIQWINLQAAFDIFQAERAFGDPGDNVQINK